MIIRALKLHLATAQGPFGFELHFSRHLTIIKGKNSSGKSTLFNSMLYGLGMEELVGAKSAKALTYSVRTHFDYDGAPVEIQSSEVLVEVENRDAEVVTLRRAIQDPARSDRLIEISNSATLTESSTFRADHFTYIHDPGSASEREGFFFYLERFLGLHLPKVGNTSGSQSKLYLQTIFAAHAVEQKRGWTDYIAAIPFYGIREARTRVAEYILGLDVFETIAKRNQLNAESSSIDLDWKQHADALRRESASHGFSVSGLPAAVLTPFSPQAVSITRPANQGTLDLTSYIGLLHEEHSNCSNDPDGEESPSTKTLRQRLGTAEHSLQRVAALYERTSSHLETLKASRAELILLLREAEDDLARNRAAEKLRTLGAQQDFALAAGNCPVCHQQVEDSLVIDRHQGNQMSLETNIAHLESQKRMLDRQIAAADEAIAATEASVAGAAADLDKARDHATALRADLGASAQEAKSSLRRSIKLELEIARLEAFEASSKGQVSELYMISERLAANRAARAALPRFLYSDSDKERIRLFEKNFRANATAFDYDSVADASDIKISDENLIPSLRSIELREHHRAPQPVVNDRRGTSDIRADSSASDFVRLIWSYLLGLYQTSAMASPPGNHLGVLLFDEPGQHSMSQLSQRALFRELAAQPKLQSIVAASFDDSPDVFEFVTDGLNFKLISWDGKLIRPMPASDDQVLGN